MLRASVDEYGVSLAIMTMGTDGAFVYDGETIYEKAPYNVSGGAKDTTGCGDSWISGFITSYMDNMSRLEQMCGETPVPFITEENKEDARKHIIELSMCMANLKARQTTQIKGAYGCGIPISEYKG